jgi:hypothetical protein
VTGEDWSHSNVLLSGEFMHGDDLNNVSLKLDPRMAEIPKLIIKYKDYLTYSKPDKAETKASL